MAWEKRWADNTQTKKWAQKHFYLELIFKSSRVEPYQGVFIILPFSTFRLT